jgi:excisionase family DNA binding protein
MDHVPGAVPLLMTVAQAADRLGLSEYQVRQEHGRGVLPGRRAGRFIRITDDDIATYLDRIRDDKASNASGLTPLSRARKRRSARK